MPYQPEGDPLTADYITVGEAPAKNEIVLGRPLVGDSGRIYDRCSEKSNVPRRKTYITNVFDEMVRKKENSPIIYTESGEILWTPNGFTSLGMRSVSRLHHELAGSKATTILALGGTALNAFTPFTKILKYRGSVYETFLESGERKKVIGTIHPAATLIFRGNYIWRYLIIRDMARFRINAQTEELKRPLYQFSLDPSFVEIISYLDYILEHKPFITIDIEISGIQCSRISFAISNERCLSINFSKFTIEDEIRLWLKIQQVMKDPLIVKGFQNGIFDLSFLQNECNIICVGPYEDSMVLHSIIYPEFPKSLAFLCSIYTDQPYYKDMVSHGGIDKEDG